MAVKTVRVRFQDGTMREVQVPGEWTVGRFRAALGARLGMRLGQDGVVAYELRDAETGAPIDDGATVEAIRVGEGRVVVAVPMLAKPFLPVPPSSTPSPAARAEPLPAAQVPTSGGVLAAPNPPAPGAPPVVERKPSIPQPSHAMEEEKAPAPPPRPTVWEEPQPQCWRCSQYVLQGARFCSHCGAGLLEAPPETSTGRISGAPHGGLGQAQASGTPALVSAAQPESVSRTVLGAVTAAGGQGVSLPPVAAMTLVAVAAFFMLFSFTLSALSLRWEFGWSLNATSIAYLLVFVSGIAWLLAASFVARSYGVRPVLLLMVGLFTLGVVVTRFVDGIVPMYLFGDVLMGGVAVALGVIGTSAYAQRPEQRPKAGSQRQLALFWLGPMVLALVWGILADAVGWRQAALAVGLGGAFAMLFIVSKVNQLGVGCTTAPEPGAGGMVPRWVASENYLPPLATRLLGCVCTGMGLVYLVLLAFMLTGGGLWTAVVPVAISVGTLVSSLAFPDMGKPRGGRRVLVMALLAQSLVLLLITGLGRQGYVTVSSLVTLSTLFGLCSGVMLNGLFAPVWPLETSGGVGGLRVRDWAVGLLGMGVGGWGGGWLLDTTDGFTWVFVAAALCGLAAAGVALAHPGRVISRS